MSIKRALNKESSYEISLKLDEKCSRGITYSSQIVFFQSLHYTCFSSAICPLQVPDLQSRNNPDSADHVVKITDSLDCLGWGVHTGSKNLRRRKIVKIPDSYDS